MDRIHDWDDALDGLPRGWRLGRVRYFPETGDWQACAETIEGNGCVMGTGPDCETAMVDLLDRLAARRTHPHQATLQR